MLLNTSFRFARKKRALEKTDFMHIMRNPEIRISTQDFVLLVRQNQLGCTRLGFIISKKNVKRAILRNSIKRVVRESVRLNQSRLINHDLVVIIKKTATKPTKEDLRAKLEKQWNIMLRSSDTRP